MATVGGTSTDSELRTYSNPLLHRTPPDDEPAAAAATNDKRSPNSKKSSRGFAKKLPLLRRTKSNKDVRSTSTIDGSSSSSSSSSLLASSPDRITPRPLLQLQREELERHNAAVAPQGLAKWTQKLSAEERQQKRLRYKNKDRVDIPPTLPPTPAAGSATSPRWVAGKTTRCNSSDDKHHRNTRWNARNVGEPYESDDEDSDVDTTTTKRERRGAVVEALALSPRAGDGHGFGGRRPPNARCARAQLAALPYALTAFESPER